MVINLSPSVTNENETTSSLQFAERLKKVKLEVVNKNMPSQGKLSNLKQELEQERLRRQELEQQLQQHMQGGTLSPNMSQMSQMSQVQGELLK